MHAKPTIGNVIVTERIRDWGSAGCRSMVGAISGVSATRVRREPTPAPIRHATGSHFMLELPEEPDQAEAPLTCVRCQGVLPAPGREAYTCARVHLILARGFCACRPAR
ncbi:hypothetical protein GCM10022248_93450 [Nonomuraea soli]